MNNPGEFNNEYYRELLQSWRKDTGRTAAHTEWVRGGGPTGAPKRIMLNADMELAFNVVDELATINVCGGDNVGGQGQCTRNTELSGLATSFATNNAEWLRAFSASYKRMTEVGYADDTLTCVQDAAGNLLGGVSATQCGSTTPSTPTADDTTEVPTTVLPTTVQDEPSTSVESTGSSNGRDRPNVVLFMVRPSSPSLLP